jgi:hypothetical protein
MMTLLDNIKLLQDKTEKPVFLEREQCLRSGDLSVEPSCRRNAFGVQCIGFRAYRRQCSRNRVNVPAIDLFGRYKNVLSKWCLIFPTLSIIRKSAMSCSLESL